MAHDINAKLNNISMSAQKVRLVVDVVRGKKAVDALNILRFLPNGSSDVRFPKSLHQQLPMLKRTLE